MPHPLIQTTGRRKAAVAREAGIMDELAQVGETLATTAEGFQMWNAYVSLDSGEAWSTRLYVNNLLDEIGVINSANLEQNGPRRSQIISRPRTVGLGFTYAF